MIVIFIAMGASEFLLGTPARYGDGPLHIIPEIVEFVGAFGVLGVGVFGLLVTISAYRRTPQGSALKRRAKAMIVAFVARDALWLVIIGTAIAFSIAGNAAIGDQLWAYGPAVAILVYVPILSYGILRTQLFDIDLKIKVGIRRGTVVGVILVAVFVAAKVVEVYLNRTVGVIAGSVVAGTLLFLVPKLNKFGERVASTALPKVENTGAYREFRKLEVYKAAVDSALETGDLTDKERDGLRRLRGKLGITEADGSALENDVRERLAPA